MRQQASLPAIDIEHAQHDFFFAAPDADHAVEVTKENSSNSRPDCVEIAEMNGGLYLRYKLRTLVSN
eukprot:1290836-Pyramimonas_sp.AAC.1